jgi:Sulfotransferase domain
VINSYIKKREDPALEDLGFVQQAEIFDFVRTRTNAVPPVVDAKDVLQNPERTLRLLCKAVGVGFSKSMLSWPPGLRETDGIWAQHWYGEVAKTTSFQSYRPTDYEVPQRFHEVYERCRECYERLYQYRLL